MRIIEAKENNLNFVLYQSFESRLFSPIGKYVNWKLENNWDDYNELYHSVNYIESLKGIDGIWYEIHTIEKSGDIKGVLTIVGGDIEKLGDENSLDSRDTILLKYFHIVEKGKGYGSHWLSSIIFPYYFNKGFRKVYVSSSHPKSFGFYKRIGNEIKCYTKKSDNKLYVRDCKSFLISIDVQKKSMANTT
ncbi:MAG: hypothetical protein ACFB0B_02450 [Thermonemataceae bacterium]|mgnify:CR=1 FL=1